MHFASRIFSYIYRQYNNPFTLDILSKTSDFKFLEARPGITMILLADKPLYTIVAVSNDFVSTSGRKREEVVGNSLFEIFPENPADPASSGVHSLLRSFDYILEHKTTHSLPLVRYDIPDGKGGFQEKYWKSTNAPVLNEKGEVEYVIHTSEDVTDQVRAEKREDQIKGVERAYDLFMQAPVAVCIVSGEDHVVDLANQGMLQLLGRTKEMVGKPLAQTLTEAREQGLLSVLEGVYATGQSHHTPAFPAELLIDGQRERRYFDLVFQPYYQSPEDQKPASIFCIAYNITEQVQARQKLQESQQELQLAIDAADLGTFRLELFTNQATNSQKVNEWFGYTVQGFSREEGFNPIHPEDRGRVEEVILNTLTSEDNSHHDVSYRVVHQKSGVVRHLRSFGKTMFNDQGKPYLIIGIIQNITQQTIQQQQLEESEARARAAIEIARLGTFEIDVQKNFIIHSPRNAEILGLDPTKQWPYQTIVETVHPEDRDIRSKALEEAKQTGVLFYEARILRHDQTVRWVRLNGRYIEQESGPRIIGTLMDISEEKKAAEVLEQKVEERTYKLQQVNNQLKEFTYAASHDLQEPLRKISYFVDLLVASVGPVMNDDGKRMAERIQHTTKRMRNLIDDLLSYSNATMGVTGFEKVNLYNIAKEALDDMEATVMEKKASIELHPLPSVNGDQRQLRQLFQNLLSNAIKYHKKGTSPQVQIISKLVSSDEIKADMPQPIRKGVFYQIQVMDNGIGFDPDDAERIFRIFQRLHGKSEYEGTGVGLAIVQKVVENHQGYIWAESVPGEGATFNVLLPVE